MAKIVMKGTGDVSRTASAMHQAVMNSGMSANVVDETRTQHGDVVVYLTVYEKFFYRAQNRVSLSVEIVGMGNEIIVNAIASGGGQGPIFKMDWGAESDFAYVVVKPLRQLGFELINQS